MAQSTWPVPIPTPVDPLLAYLVPAFTLQWGQSLLVLDNSVPPLPQGPLVPHSGQPSLLPTLSLPSWHQHLR